MLSTDLNFRAVPISRTRTGVRLERAVAEADSPHQTRTRARTRTARNLPRPDRRRLDLGSAVG